MGHLAAPQTKHELTDIEVVSDDGLRVMLFSRNDSGAIVISTRDATADYWSSDRFATLVADDAKVISSLFSGGNLQGYGAPKTRIEQMSTGHYTVPKPADSTEVTSDCTQLDIERARADNLREERENIQLQMERDHALDKHVTADVSGCPACQRKSNDLDI